MKRLPYLLKLVSVNLLVFLVLLLLLEVGMRHFNYSGLYKYKIIAEPYGCIIPNDRLGFELGEGSYRVTINDSLQYSVTQKADRFHPRRITQTQRDTSAKKSQLFLTGCSFTYGMGVEDEESYPYLLQQSFPDWEIINGAVPAYGAIQALLLLEEQMEGGHPPDIFIYNYLDFHQFRNVLSPSFQQHLYQESQVDDPNQTKDLIFPYGYLDSLGVLHIGHQKIKSQNIFGKLRNYSAIANEIEFCYNQFRDRHLNPEKVTEAVLLEMKKQCEAAQIDFIIAVIQEKEADSWIFPFCQKHQINLMDLRLDYTDASNLNLPYDGHPSAKGHRALADKVIHYLQERDSLF